jgi:hypothetical protein
LSRCVIRSRGSSDHITFRLPTAPPPPVLCSRAFQLSAVDVGQRTAVEKRANDSSVHVAFAGSRYFTEPRTFLPNAPPDHCFVYIQTRSPLFCTNYQRFLAPRNRRPFVIRPDSLSSSLTPQIQGYLEAKVPSIFPLPRFQR